MSCSLPATSTGSQQVCVGVRVTWTLSYLSVRSGAGRCIAHVNSAVQPSMSAGEVP